LEIVQRIAFVSSARCLTPSRLAINTASLGSVAWMDTTVNFADADRGIGRVPTLDLLWLLSHRIVARL